MRLYHENIFQPGSLAVRIQLPGFGIPIKLTSKDLPEQTATVALTQLTS